MRWDVQYNGEPASYVLSFVEEQSINSKTTKKRDNKMTKKWYVASVVSPDVKRQKQKDIEPSDLGYVLFNLRGEGATMSFETGNVFNAIHKNNPRTYIDAFIAAAKDYDIDLSHLDMDKVYTTYTTFDDDSIIALAAGMDEDCEVNIGISLKKWNNSTEFERMYIMFHELAHDIFNIRHSDGIRLMATTAVNNPDWFYVGTVIHEMFERASSDLKHRYGKCFKKQ